MNFMKVFKKGLFLVLGIALLALSITSCTKKIFKVSFYDDTKLISEADVKSGDKVERPTNPAKDGYTFSNWYTDTELKNVYDFDSKVSKSFSLYAKFNINTYTITFNSNGGSDVASISANYNTSITLPINPTKDGYTFDGWYTDSNLGTKFNVESKITGNITLYAKWLNNITYTVRFNSAGGSDVDSQTVRKDELAVKPTDPVRDGYRFDGWFIANTETLYDFTLPVTENLNLVAKWTDITPTTTFTVRFNSDGGTEINDVTVVNGETVARPTEPEKVGFTFLGWFKEGEDTLYDFTTPVTNNLVLVAHWEEIIINEYTVTFNSMGGSEVTSQVVEEGNKVTKPEDPTRHRYAFKGWFLDDLEYDFNSVVSSDITLVAKWEINSTTLIDMALLKEDREIRFSAIENFSDIDYLIQGLYANENSDNIYAALDEEGNIKIHDSDSSKSCYAYLTYGGAIEKGEIEVEFTFTPTKAASKWSPIHIIGTTDDKTSPSSIFSIGFENNHKYFSYGINGSNNTLDKDNASYVSEESLFNAIALEANKTYEILININITNGNITYYVDEKKVISTTIEGLKGIYGMYFMTADSDAARDFTIGSLKLEYIGNVSSFKEFVVSYIDQLLEALDIENKYTHNLSELNIIIGHAKETIERSNTYDEVNTPFRALVIALFECESDEVIDLREARESALTNLASYVVDLTFAMLDEVGFPLDNETTITSSLGLIEFLSDIINETTLYDMTRVLGEAKALVDSLKDGGEVIARRYLAVAKLNIANEFPKANYTVNAAAYEKVFTDLEALALTLTKDEYDEAIANARVALAEIKTDAQAFEEKKAEAKTEIANYKKSEIDALDVTDEAIKDVKDRIDDAILEAQSLMDDAEDIDELNQLLASAKLDIDTLLAEAKGDLDALKTAKVLALNTYKTNAVKDLDEAVDAELIASINEVVIASDMSSITTIADLNTAYDTACASVDSILLAGLKLKAITKLNNVKDTGISTLKYEVSNTPFETELNQIVEEGTTAINAATLKTIDTVRESYVTLINNKIADIKSKTEFMVTYHLEGGEFEGEVINPREIYLDGVITKPDNPVKANFKFAYWATKDSNNNYTEYNFTTTVTGNVDLYAIWNDLSVLYVFAETSSTVDSRVVVVDMDSTGVVSVVATGVDNPINANNKSLDGYSFTSRFAPGGTMTASNRHVVIDLSTFTGKIKVTVYGMSSSSTATRTALINDLDNIGDIDEAFLVFTNDGKAIGKASCTLDGGVIYYLGSQNSGFNFYGIRLEFGTFNTVTFDSMGGSAVLSDTVVDGGKLVAPTAPTKTGYLFDKWNTRSGSEGSYTYTPFDFNTPITSELTLYASWTPIKYNVAFDSNGGEGEMATLTNIEYGVEFNLPAATFTKQDMVFAGWMRITNGDISYLDQASVSNLVTEDSGTITLYAKYVSGAVTFVSLSGYDAGLYLTFIPVNTTTPSDYIVKYKKTDDSVYKTVDEKLIRSVGSEMRVDILGLASDYYDVKVIYNNEDVIDKTQIAVSAQDTSGYAHYNYTNGVGAYNDNGTLKTDAIVIYVTDETKNTVNANIGGHNCTGLGEIIKYAKDSTVPIDIRIIGEIATAQWNKITYTSESKSTALFEEQKTSLGNTTTDKIEAETILTEGWNSYSDDLANNITILNGLTSYATYKYDSSKNIESYDSYWNMMELKEASNITIEGVGDDASLFQWGFTIKKCNSIEIKNLTFNNYTEDAVGIEGDKSNISNYGNYWLHNLTLNPGVNNWDLSYEKDKDDGDGSTDFKYAHNLTISYCIYNDTHKTNLLGSDNAAKQYNITLHHNYYNECKSRLPLVRQANIHMYNNYYKDTTSTGISVRALSFAFIENNYFDGKNPFMLGYKVSNDVNPIGTTIKAIGNIFTSNVTVSALGKDTDQGLGLMENGIYVLIASNTASADSYTKDLSATRTTLAENSICTPNGTNDYSNFDTNSSLFYYDNINHVSDVFFMSNTEDVPTDVLKYAGAGTKYGPLKPGAYSEKPKVTFVYDNGDENQVITVNSEYKVEKPVDPVKIETDKYLYRFAGWVTRSGNPVVETPYNFDSLVNNDLTIYAKWDEYKKISTVDDFISFRESGDNTGKYVLTNDLDLEGYTFNQTKLTGFSGVFDGLGHTINNLSYTITSPKSGFLFEKVIGGKVTDVKFMICSVTGSAQGIGLIAGLVSGGSTFSKIEFNHCSLVNSEGANYGGAYGGLIAGELNEVTPYGDIYISEITAKNGTYVECHQYGGLLFGDVNAQNNVHLRYLMLDATFTSTGSGSFVFGRVRGGNHEIIESAIYPTLGNTNNPILINSGANRLYVERVLIYTEQYSTNIAASGITFNNNRDNLTGFDAIDSYSSKQTTGFLLPNLQESNFFEIYLNFDCINIWVNEGDNEVRLACSSPNYKNESIEAIEISTVNATTRFKLGDSFSSSGLVVIGSDSNGDKYILDSTLYQIDSNAFNNNEIGEYTITVKYSHDESVNTTYKVRVVDTTGYSVNDEFVTKSYYLGQDLDMSNLKVYSHWSDGLVEELSVGSGYTLNTTAYDNNQEGEYTLVISYLSFANYEFKVNVVGSKPKVIDNHIYVNVNASQEESYKLVNGVESFKKVTDAIRYLEACSFDSSVIKVIYIAAGTYNEKITTSLANLHLIGEDKDTTAITYSAVESTINPLTGSAYVLSCATIEVTGIGFAAENIQIRNDFDYLTNMTTKAEASPQGIALTIAGDGAVFNNVLLYGNQDTLYLKQGRAYFSNSEIDGNVDFIFGNNNGIGFFENCTIKAINRGNTSQTGYVTAMKVDNTNEKPTYGYVFKSCTFISDDIVPNHSMSLGRPWGRYATVAYINCSFTAAYSTTGYSEGQSGMPRWAEMSGNSPVNADFAEYGSTGDGKVTASIPGGRVLSEEQAANYTLTNVLANTNGNVTFNTSFNFANMLTALIAEATTTAATEIVVTNDNYSIEKNKTSALSFYVNPWNASNKVITYVVADDTIIDYDGKTITAKQQGNTTITFTCGSIEKVVAVQVTEPTNNYTVTFMDGETTVSTSTGPAGDPLAFPASTAKDGYQFVRYYSDSTFLKVFDSTVIPDEDMTVYLRYMDLNVANVVYVTTADELVTAIANNRTIYLKNDIDFDGSTYNGQTSNFNGSVYGFGYKILNWEPTYSATKSGFFGVIYQGTIEDIIFKDCTVSDGGTGLQYIGLLAGQVYSSETLSKISFINCHMNTNASNTLGLFGEGVANNSSQVLNISHVTINSCSVSGTQYVGGLFGRDNNSFTITDLTVTGLTINPDGIGISNSGGLVGKNSATITITDANISLTFKGNASSDQYNGGLIGYTETSGRFTITNARTEITGISILKTFGGVVGRIKSGGQGTVTNSNITANITASQTYLGGIVGLHEGALSVTNTNVDITISGAYSIGGVIGEITASSGTATFNTVHVTGSITASNGSSNYENTFIGHVNGSLATPIDYDTCTYSSFTLTGASATLQGTEV